MLPILGYRPNFISSLLKVNLPVLNDEQKSDLVSHDDEWEWKYKHYSLAMCKSRKLAYYTASNLNGKLFKSVKRASLFPSGNDEWKNDPRFKNHQWGVELYKAQKSDFDRGHLVKREDTQWGYTKNDAKNAALDTFHYSNCAPQLPELNQKKWENLEFYILKKETVQYKLKVNLFTGPVLNFSDPHFVTIVDHQQIKLPVLFWKVIYYSSDGKQLKVAAFLMGQETLMRQKGIIGEARTRLLNEHFQNFEDAETYQVNIKTIEQLTGLTFQNAFEPYVDPRPMKILLSDIQVRDGFSMDENPMIDEFEYSGISL